MTKEIKIYFKKYIAYMTIDNNKKNSFILNFSKEIVLYLGLIISFVLNIGAIIKLIELQNELKILKHSNQILKEKITNLTQQLEHCLKKMSEDSEKFQLYWNNW
jgi:hypothetical protein